MADPVREFVRQAIREINPVEGLPRWVNAELMWEDLEEFAMKRLKERELKAGASLDVFMTFEFYANLYAEGGIGVTIPSTILRRI